MSTDQQHQANGTTSAVDDGPVAAAQTLLGLSAKFPVSFGQYEIHRLLGRGGMGSVYDARNVHLQKRVALKTISSERLGDDGALRRFRTEMEAVGRLDHPNVVQALDAGQWQGIHYLAMEYVDGINVENLAARHDRLPIPVCCEIVRQAAYGLEHAHVNGLVHRDVKPSNLICSRDGRVVLLDLGLARCRQIRGDLTGSDMIIGTADYISPEQAEGKSDLDARCDVYSLGATLYRLLAGHPPFCNPDYDSAIRKLDGHRHDPPPPIELERDDVPPKLAQLVHRMMAKSPGDRPQSAFDVAAELADWCDGSNLAFLVSNNRDSDNGKRPAFVTTKKYVDSTRHSSEASRKSRVVWFAAIGLIVAVGTGGYFWRPGHNSPAEHPNRKPTIVSDGASATGSDDGRTESGNPQWFEDLPPDQILSSISYQLLNREPRKILWDHDDGLATLSLDRRRRQLAVHCRGRAVLQFGRVEQRSYTLEMDIFQRPWSGDVGVYLGLPDEATEVRRFLGVMLTQNRGTGNQEAQLMLTPTRYLLQEIGNGQPLLKSSTVDGQFPLQQPAAFNPSTLRLVVRDGRLQSIEWDGKVVDGFVEIGAVTDPSVPDMVGGFGIVLQTQHATVHNARITIGR